MPRCAGLVERDEGERLSALAGLVPHEWAVVELGSHTGLSTCWMAEGVKHGQRAHITAVDPWGDPRPDSLDDPYELGAGDNVLARFLANIASEGHAGRVTPLRAKSTDVAPSWVQPIGLLFIDSIHEYDPMVRDAADWLGFIPVGGWLAFHDYNTDPLHPYEGVKRAIDDVIVPSGEWGKATVIGSLWSARRLR